MPGIEKIVMIGAGNLGTQLAKALFRKGKKILQVFSNTSSSAHLLAGQVEAAPVTDFDKITTKADLYIISVPDDVIGKIVKKIYVDDKIIVHTSGSVDMKILQGVSERFGVFYPLLTFSRNKDVSFKTTPLCIEANNNNVENLLTNLAGEISDDVRIFNSDQRKYLHLAAVFASNFTNYMCLVAEDILKIKDMPFDLLIPIIIETADKLIHETPLEAQTGPAIREDAGIIAKHLNMLELDKEKKEIYKLISENIRNLKYRKKQHGEKL